MKVLKYNFFVIFLFASSTATYAQTATDSSFHSHLKQYNIKEETVVTATRTERKLSNVAIPTKIITQKSIKQAGSMRLSDILQEQSGLFLTSGFGTGVQMQGLNPDYTLIMINGEPLVGRTSGVLDLNRLAVGNIKKIEIVKGPSSSLYGSEAMAGVINIITDQTPNNKLATSLRYGTYNTKDFNCNTTFSKGKFTFSHFLNSYQSDGFSIRPYAVERTVAPIWRLTNQFHTSYQASAKTKIDIDLRYAYEHIQNEIAVTNNGIITYSKGNEYHKDFNLNPVITHLFSSKLKSTLRLYATNYNADQNLNTSGNSIYDDQLNHQFVRVENQTDYYLNDQISFNLTGSSSYTITLASALPTIVDASSTVGAGTAGTVTINGLGATVLSISVNNGVSGRNFNIFNIASGGNLTISGVTVSGAKTSGNGGAFNNQGTLAVSNSTLSGNSAGTFGGAIFNNNGAITLTNSTLSGNNATYGGGISNKFGTITIRYSS